MHPAARRRARAAARRRFLQPRYPRSTPPPSLQATVAEAPTSHIESWRGLMAAAAALIRRQPAVTEIAIAPMSEAWLREHDATTPKHEEQV